jgi:D-arabinose 1-dehydrogenase-like Zn-dependent alcohol dehydrogenase
MTMKAIGLTEFGGPEVLKVIDLPEPEPGPGEVRTLRVADVLPATMATEAQRRLTAGGVRGRLVLDFSQPL